MNTPQVSICLLTYNRADRLRKTLESILNQSFPDFELIIADDCSTDATEEICLQYARMDKRIKYIRNLANLGMPGNLNAALQTASGKYLANLHDGDIYHKDLIARWEKALDTYPSAGFVFNAYRVVNDDGSARVYHESYPPLIQGRELVRRLLSQWSSCVFGTVMARRSVYERLGWFDPQFGNFSDVDMWIRIASFYDVAYINTPLMDLMPRDSSRFYSFVHWKVAFWILGIHTLNVRRNRLLLSDLTSQLQKRYRRRRRKYLIRLMLLCLKHRRWDRVREGLAIWRDADDRLLKSLGVLLGHVKDLPEWYNRDYWGRIRL